MATISCNSTEMVPKECHSMGARSGTASLFLESSSSAPAEKEQEGDQKILQKIYIIRLQHMDMSEAQEHGRTPKSTKFYKPL